MRRLFDGPALRRVIERRGHSCAASAVCSEGAATAGAGYAAATSHTGQDGETLQAARWFSW